LQAVEGANDAQSAEASSNEESESEEGSNSGETIENLEDVLKLMHAQAPASPIGPKHGLDLADHCDDMDIDIKETDDIIHVGRVTSMIDGVLVVQVLHDTTYRRYSTQCFEPVIP
jgi:hypothetical protein